jgi:hypothetical protein
VEPFRKVSSAYWLRSVPARRSISWSAANTAMALARLDVLHARVSGRLFWPCPRERWTPSKRACPSWEDSAGSSPPELKGKRAKLSLRASRKLAFSESLGTAEPALSRENTHCRIMAASLLQHAAELHQHPRGIDTGNAH